MKNVITFLSVTIVLIALFISGCSDRADITASYKERPPTPLTYTTDIKPFLDANCASSCHSAATHLGSYDLSTYAGVLGNGSDATANVIPGDANSLLITKLAEGHMSVSQANQDLIYEWIVTYMADEN